MSRDTLTVGDSRRIVQEVLRALGISKPQGVDRPLPDDDNPITIESFRKVMREGLEKIFTSVSSGGEILQKIPGVLYEDLSDLHKPLLTVGDLKKALRQRLLMISVAAPKELEPGENDSEPLTPSNLIVTLGPALTQMRQTVLGAATTAEPKGKDELLGDARTAIEGYLLAHLRDVLGHELREEKRHQVHKAVKRLTDRTLDILLEEIEACYPFLPKSTEKRSPEEQEAEEEPSKAQAELERLREEPEQILLDVADSLKVEPHRRILVGFAVLLNRANDPGPSAFDPESWATLTGGLSVAIEECMDAQDTILDQAWEKCRGPEDG